MLLVPIILLWSVVFFICSYGIGSIWNIPHKNQTLQFLIGCATILSLSSGLLLVGLFNIYSIWGILSIGLIIYIYNIITIRRKLIPCVKQRLKPYLNPKILGLIIIAGTVLILNAITFLNPQHINGYDDLVCYLALVEKAVQSSSLVDPFNTRRIGTYGGQIVLQAFTMQIGGLYSAYLLEYLFQGLLFLLVITKINHRKTSYILLFAVSTILLVYPKVNTASVTTGILFVYGVLIMTKAYLGNNKLLIPTGLLISALASLRPTYIVFLGVFFIILISFCTYKKALIKLGSISAVLLSPWAIMLYLSSNTIIYPPFLGNMNIDFTNIGAGPYIGLKHTFISIFNIKIFPFYFFFCYILFSNQPIYNKVIAVANIFTALIITIKFSPAPFDEIYRYNLPSFMGSMVFITTKYINSSFKWVILVFAIAMISTGISYSNWLWLNVNNEYQRMLIMKYGMPPKKINYLQDLQHSTEPNSKILALVDEVNKFNHARNIIHSGDLLGGASPQDILKKSLTSKQLEEALYKLGYKYIIEENNGRYLYNRKLWIEHPRPEQYFTEIWGKEILRIRHLVDDLKQKNRIEQKAEFTLIFLGQQK